MPRHRKLLILVLVLVVAATAAVVVYQRVARPARAVLLLPDGNFLLYVNFSPAHFLDLSRMPVPSDPEYKDFLDQTGFHFEHNLDTIAVSQRNPGDMNSESSAVFTGTFDQDRLGRYLQKLSKNTEIYAGKTIFSIAQENHTVRACIIDPKTVAITNTESSDPMHGIIDRARGLVFARSGPSLVRDYYDNVPFASLAWAILRVPSGASELPGGINMDFLQNSVAVVSVRYTGSIRVKAEIISPSESAAAKVLEAANLLVAFSKQIKQSFNAPTPDKDVNAAFDSIQAQRNGNRTVLSATIPPAAVQKLANEINH